MNAPAVTNEADIAKRVGQYVAIRDKIKELEENHAIQLKPYKDTLEGLANLMLKHLNDMGIESARTDNGTVYKSARVSASIADPSAFWDYVLKNKDWDMIDKRANKTAVSDYVDTNGSAPPGVNYSVMSVVGVRRA